MSTTSRAMQCSPDDVFSVLRDGWIFPLWVVGAARIRDVDEAWPSAGSSIAHSVGPWPLLIDDTTTVLEHDPPRSMRLRARAWPTGEAEVRIDVQPTGDGCVVTMREQATEGPATLIPKPLQDLALHARNTESLRRLAYLAENREARRHHAVDRS